MKKILLLIGGLFLFQVQGAQAKMRICYFSFNNQSEVQTTQQLVDQVNEVASNKIEVKEYLTEFSNPSASFEKMVASGEKCDGLVITGHHTGAHAGARAAGKLDLEFIEKLSCDPRYSNWFNSVNAVWLEGCRTMGVGEITPDNESELTRTVDFHVKRVTNERQADGIAQSVANLDHEFSTTLDQDNPLSSRYLRGFVMAKMFGWTNSAPGAKSDSELSFLFHMAHISKYLDPADGLPEDPTNLALSPKGLQQYLDAITLSLMPFDYNNRSCEEIAVQGWIDHGTYSAANPYYSFDNADLTASTSLMNKGDPNPLRIKAMQCALKNAAQAKDETKILQAIDQMNADPSSYSYNIGSMLSVYEELKAEKSKTAKVIFERIKANPQLATFLDRKINSNQVGFVRRVDYLNIYKELTGYTNPEVERVLQDKLIEEMQKDLPTNDKYLRSNTSAYRTTILQALLKNKIGGKAYYQELLEHNPEWDILMNMIKCVSYQGWSKEEQKAMIIQILHSPRADPVVWRKAVEHFQRLKVSSDEINEIYDNLILIEEFKFPEDGEIDLLDPNSSNSNQNNIPSYDFTSNNNNNNPNSYDRANNDLGISGAMDGNTTQVIPPKKKEKKSIWGTFFGSSKDKKKKKKDPAKKDGSVY